MIVNIRLEITDGERTALAYEIDRRDSRNRKRKATRKEIIATAMDAFHGVLAAIPTTEEMVLCCNHSGTFDDAARCPYCNVVNTFNAEGRRSFDVECTGCGEQFLAVKKGTR